MSTAARVPRSSIAMPSVPRAAFTLVELLVVIAVIGVLVALLAPAVQASREAARRAQCQHRLRQLGIASHLHVEMHGHYPTGGWGFGWTGDADRGFGGNQPGGWVYGLLPYVEQSALRKLGAGRAPADKRIDAGLVIETPLPFMNCPTRRSARPYENDRPHPSLPWNAPVTEFVARGDYAANVGDVGANSIGGDGGPASLREGDSEFPWPPTAVYTGISYLRSEVATSDVVDGMSATYFVGEKYLNPDKYESGPESSDRGHVYTGFGVENFRLAKSFEPPSQDYRSPEAGGVTNERRFGSAHSRSCNFLFCDGSVRRISYDVDGETHRRLGNRKDGLSAAAP